MDATRERFMEKYLKYFVLMLATVLSLSLESCGGGDDEEPDQPGKPSTTDVVSGSASENYGVVLLSGVYDGPNFYWRSDKLYLINDNGRYSYVKMISVGTVSKLSDIKTVPAEGWGNELPLDNSGGYIITYTDQGKAYYIRLFITFNVSAAGDLVGINYQFQHFTPAQ